MRISHDFCQRWRFRRLDGPEFDSSLFCQADHDDSGWEEVALPHTPRLEPLVVNDLWQGLCWYRRDLRAEESWRDRKVFLEFGAAMQIADVWVNGRHLCRHAGGYQAFMVDLSEALTYGERNTIAVRLNNRDTSECPPGKPTRSLDFHYFGGLYREARLLTTPRLHISDPLRVQVEGGGGVFARFEEVSEQSATMLVKTHLLNEHDTEQQCRLVTSLLDPEGTEVARIETDGLFIVRNGDHTVEQVVQVLSPRLWHPDHPHLYRLRSGVYQGEELVDMVEGRVGIRRLSITRAGGLQLNGQPLKVLGSNRHQEYPYLGNAFSAQANRRDASKAKAAGLNYLRLAHYPQHPAFLDACDELGLLVQAPIPGWHRFHSDETFVTNCYQEVRRLLRRDRHHPSVILWEVNLNETASPQWFTRECHRIAHAEMPGNQCYTVGDSHRWQFGAVWDVLHWDDPDQDKPVLIREYGDWHFGGNQSTSRQWRGHGEAALLQQAWNFLWNHNTHGELSGLIGDAGWCLYDYNRGYAEDIAACGMMDIFRLPKFVYYFYQSQRSPELRAPGVDSGAMVFVANYWTPRESPAKVVVFSNCEEVELFVNGKPVARQGPDRGPTTPYNSREGTSPTHETVGDSDLDTSTGNPFDGGNCEHLAHPPFTFMQVPWEAGELRAVGFINGEAATEHVVRTPEAPASLALRFDLCGEPLTANGADTIFVYASVLDAHGTVVPETEAGIAFEVEGPGAVVGPSCVKAEAGVATILLRATSQPGPITVLARHAELGTTASQVVSVRAS